MKLITKSVVQKSGGQSGFRGGLDASSRSTVLATLSSLVTFDRAVRCAAAALVTFAVLSVVVFVWSWA